MNHPKILVTGATGRTGSAVVTQLLERGWPVRALVHSRDARSERLNRLGAEIVVADLFDPYQLTEAMRGTARAYYCPPWHPYMIQSAAAFAVAAQEAKLESIVGLSQWLASPAHPALETRQHWLVDHLFSMLPNMAYTIVNPGFFADSPYMQLIGYAALLSVFPFPAQGDSRNAPPSCEDIARVAVASLMNPDLHAGKAYRPTGPTLLSVNEMVTILSRVLNRKVRHVQIPLWMFYKAARMQGTSKYMLSAFRHYLADHNSGAFAVGAPTDHVFAVTGQQPESFETIARRYAAAPEMRPTAANKFHALANFMTVPFRPGLQPARFEREYSMPAPFTPRLAMEDEHWGDDHRKLAVTHSASFSREMLA